MSDRRRYPEYGSRRYQTLRRQLLAGAPKCHWGCGRPATTADHEPPLEQTGTWHWSMVPACATCNYGRRGKTPTPRVDVPSREWF